MRSFLHRLAPAAALALCVAPLAAQEQRRSEVGASHGAHQHDGDAHAVRATRATLLPGLGSWHHAVTTRSPRAQQFFDQGLRLAYAFNHDEAERAFREAARLDPSCAMCEWGVAYAAGPNINLPVSPEAERRALAAITRAQRLVAARGSARERAYVAALARRFGEPAGTDRGARDSAYADAMRDVARRFPQDADAQVLFADAMMNLRPWNQWTKDGQPQPGTLDVVAALEPIVTRVSDHAGACHLWVHAVEASSDPDRALPCADRLGALMPGAGHIVHMPAHIYLRTGRYAQAARANLAAVAADQQYFRGTATEGIYPLFYAPHNTHFLWTAYMFSGQKAKALAAARELDRTVSREVAQGVPSLEIFLVARTLAHVRFGDWDEVLALPAPPAALRYWTGTHHYARGMAHVAKGDLAAARAALDTLGRVADAMPADLIVSNNSAKAVLGVASEVLRARIAQADGRLDAAIAHLQEAVAREDRLTYDEPPAWYHGARHLLGLALLEAGRPGEAEQAFRGDLAAYRENGWSLAGLERALRAQGRTADADAVKARLEVAWKDADVPLVASR